MGKWCTEEQVRDKVAGIVGKGFNSTHIEQNINSTIHQLKAQLVTVYPRATVLGWDASRPKSIQDLTSNFAALFLKQIFIREYKTSAIEKSKTIELLDSIVAGTAEILNDNGTVVPRSSTANKVEISSDGRTPKFTEYHPDDPDYGQGSVDDLGPPTSSKEDYKGQNR